MKALLQNKDMRRLIFSSAAVTFTALTVFGIAYAMGNMETAFIFAILTAAITGFFSVASFVAAIVATATIFLASATIFFSAASIPTYIISTAIAIVIALAYSSVFAEKNKVSHQSCLTVFIIEALLLLLVITLFGNHHYDSNHNNSHTFSILVQILHH